MDIFGIGPMELILILFVALIFLGPGRMADAGRYLGKAVRDLRKATSDMSKLVLEEPEEKPLEGPKSDSSVTYDRSPMASPQEDEDTEEDSSKSEKRSE